MEAKRLRLADRPPLERFLTKEEFEPLYDGRCSECRESYKSYSNYQLFKEKKFIFSFDPIGTIKFFIRISQSNPKWFFKRLFRNFIYYRQKGYDNLETTHIWFLFFAFKKYNFYLNDLTDEYIDLNELQEVKYKNDKDGEHEKHRRHQTALVRRYYRMFGERIKLHPRRNE